MTPGEWVAILTAVAGMVGLPRVVEAWQARRQRTADARAEDERKRTAAEAGHRAELAKLDADDKSELVNELLGELRSRIEGYREDIDRLTRRHDEELRRQSAEIDRLGEENRSLSKRVAALQETVQDYRLGNRVPRGMVLVPLVTFRAIRASHPEALPQPWYPGEDDGDARAVVARITPLAVDEDAGR